MTVVCTFYFAFSALSGRAHSRHATRFNYYCPLLGRNRSHQGAGCSQTLSANCGSSSTSARRPPRSPPAPARCAPEADTGITHLLLSVAPAAASVRVGNKDAWDPGPRRLRAQLVPVPPLPRHRPGSAARRRGPGRPGARGFLRVFPSGPVRAKPD